MKKSTRIAWTLLILSICVSIASWLGFMRWNLNRTIGWGYDYSSLIWNVFFENFWVYLPAIYFWFSTKKKSRT